MFNFDWIVTICCNLMQETTFSCYAAHIPSHLNSKFQNKKRYWIKKFLGCCMSQLVKVSW
uniref:Uncharacterized protein n=1 Tax=Arundo donax TaxID=35708 RepID=A0A0A9T1Q8_ARUDO